MDAPEPFWPDPARRGGEQRPPRCGIVDLGSNSVRLVVFEGRGRNPQAIFNEKAVLGLGRGLQNSGRLNEEAIGTALTVMGRYAAIGRAMRAEPMEVLATAEDGLIEAVHAPSLSPFLFAVQWHPEWQAALNPDSVKIFQAFGDACHRSMAARNSRQAA